MTNRGGGSDGSPSTIRVLTSLWELPGVGTGLCAGPSVSSDAMGESAGAREPRWEAPAGRRLPAKLTLAVTPLAVAALITGLLLLFGVWGDGSIQALSLTVGSVLVLLAVVTIGVVLFMARSMSRDIEEITEATQQVADRDLVELLETLRDPETDISAIEPLTLDSDRDDEIGELARSLERVHGAVIEVGAMQMEALRSGVSSIFATLARRNSSLVDRQLALLDRLEAHEENPEILSRYYQLDHFATRMRRNAESLLVLAGSESRRVWADATDIIDVVRAAVGEVDEYHRVEILTLEPARLSGGAVSDVSHLLAELLENAIQFSPPSEAVRVTGLFESGGYQLSITDRGVGMSDSRISEANRVLENPPALGLSVEPTLGMHVVSKLAHRHGVSVELIRGVPGMTARVTIPRDHLEAVETPQPVFTGYEARKTSPIGPRPEELTDAATRQYVLERTRSSAESAEVIDLTTPDMTEQIELPVRQPGSAFAEPGDVVATGPGEGSVELKSALEAYDRGRKAAAELRETEGGQDDE